MRIQRLILLSSALLLLLAGCGSPSDPNFPEEQRQPRDSTETTDFRLPGN